MTEKDFKVGGWIMFGSSSRCYIAKITKIEDESISSMFIYNGNPHDIGYEHSMSLVDLIDGIQNNEYFFRSPTNNKRDVVEFIFEKIPEYGK